MGNYGTIHRTDYRGRRPTREVRVGEALIGGGNPISVQSMTNTATLDTASTVRQIIRIAGAGADIVRLTVRSIKEAENLSVIKSELCHRGCFIPLVADVHFNPAIAEVAAAIVDKVRINPGNYGIASGRATGDFSDEDYSIELGKARAAFSRLVHICRKHNTALRVGVNHGSLSPRIISRYGNTPEGMASSAMEFLQFCREEDFHNVVVSLKSSNTLVMVSANRLIVDYMEQEGMDYPLHLGVTEAGEGEDGRIRSVAGIGTLLASGTGDTIRVSLTEDPEKEIPVARRLIEHIGKQHGEGPQMEAPLSGAAGGSAGPATSAETESSAPSTLSGNDSSDPVTSAEAASPGPPPSGEDESPGPATPASGSTGPSTSAKSAGPGPATPGPGSITPLSLLRRRVSVSVCNIGGDNVPVVLSSGERSAADYRFPGRASVPGGYPLAGGNDFMTGDFDMADIFFLQAPVSKLAGRLLEKVAGNSRAVIIAVSESANPVEEIKSLIERVETTKATNPVILKKQYESVSAGDFQIMAAADFSPLLIDRLIDGLWLEHSAVDTGREGVLEGNAGRSSISGISSEGYLPATGTAEDISTVTVSTAYSILQSTRARVTKTEFISCPSCGRTMFDIQKTLAEVKSKTSHLKGLKIAVMGCIVNGPGEMADADYGIVGSGRAKVTLYRKQTPLLRNVPEEKAVDELIALIRESDDWRKE